MIDKIWKATPGYNGRQVDIEASYNNMKKLKEFDQKYLEFKEVSPSVHLEDLSPAQFIEAIQIKNGRINNKCGMGK